VHSRYGYAARDAVVGNWLPRVGALPMPPGPAPIPPVDASAFPVENAVQIASTAFPVGAKCPLQHLDFLFRHCFDPPVLPTSASRVRATARPSRGALGVKCTPRAELAAAVRVGNELAQRDGQSIVLHGLRMQQPLNPRAATTSHRRRLRYSADFRLLVSHVVSPGAAPVPCPRYRPVRTS